PERGRPVDQRRTRRRGGRGPRRANRASAQILPPACLVEPVAALRELRGTPGRDPRDAAARRRLPPRAQPAKPDRAWRGIGPAIAARPRSTRPQGKRATDMEMTSTRSVPAPPETVWAALNDPAVLKGCIPGCETFEPEGENAFRIALAA